MYPWLLFNEETEQLYCFNGQGRRAEYLDFASGDVLRGEDLETLAPSIEEDLEKIFTAPPPALEPEPEPTDGADRFGELEILGKLGVAGMGEVYLAPEG